MATKHQNMVKLVERLKSTPMSQKEIAQFFCVNARTVIRYINELKETVPGLVQIQESGRQFRYAIQEEDVFDLRQIKNLEKMRDSLASGGNHRDARLITQVLQKINPNAEPSKVLPQLQVVDKDFYIDHGPFAEHHSDSTQSQRFLQAIQDNKVISLSYKARYDEDTANKQNIRFHPYKLSLRVGRLYVIGQREDDLGRFISIPMARITSYMTTSKTFTPMPFEIEDFYAYTWGQFTSDQEVEEITLHLKSSWLHNPFQESNFRPKIKIEKTPRQTLAHLKLRVTPDFKNWVFGHMPEVEVKKPKWLKDELKERAREIAK